MILEHNDPIGNGRNHAVYWLTMDISYQCQEIEDPSTDRNTDYLYTPL